MVEQAQNLWFWHHEPASTLNATYQTLVCQDPQRLRGRGPRDAVGLAQRPDRGHRPARFDLPRLDLAPQDASHLLVHRLVPLPVDDHGRTVATSRSLPCEQRRLWYDHITTVGWHRTPCSSWTDARLTRSWTGQAEVHCDDTTCSIMHWSWQHTGFAVGPVRHARP